MSYHFHERHMIVVDGKQTYLLSHRISDNGILLDISGPETIYLHEHIVTETNGKAINLNIVIPH